MGRASLYFTYRGQAFFKDSVGSQIQDAIQRRGGAMMVYRSIFECFTHCLRYTRALTCPVSFVHTKGCFGCIYVLAFRHQYHAYEYFTQLFLNQLKFLAPLKVRYFLCLDRHA